VRAVASAGPGAGPPSPPFARSAIAFPARRTRKIRRPAAIWHNRNTVGQPEESGLKLASKCGRVGKAVVSAAVAGWLVTAHGVSAVAASTLTAPWPSGAEIERIEGERVRFPSHSPFGLSDVGTGPERDPATEAVGTLFMPRRASGESPVPAVVMLHGASGVLNQRELTYGRQLAAMGIAALAVDVFAARRNWASGFVERLLNITEAMFLADAYAALDYLDARPDVDASRVVLVGFSYGGMATTYAAYAQVAERLAQDGLRFAGHVAYYAPCIARFDDNRATGAPLLMLYGARDAIIDAQRCAEVAAELEAGGADVGTIVYEDAVHQWDGHFEGPREIGRSLADCDFRVDRTGTIRDDGWGVPMSSAFIRKIMLGLCASSDGYLIGRDDAVRQRSNRDLGAFLDRVLYRAPEG
jgi:dienelactone hydrolase